MEHLVKLNDYEISNLHAGLMTLRSLGLDTGDWLGQVLHKLPPTTHVPNKNHHQQMEMVGVDRAIQEGYRTRVIEYGILVHEVFEWLSNPDSKTVAEVEEIMRKLQEKANQFKVT